MPQQKSAQPRKNAELGAPVTTRSLHATDVPAGTLLTMSSREVAELTGRDHGNVMRDIRALLDDLQASDLKAVCETTTYAGANGQRYPQYELDRDTCLTLLLGYDAVARMRVVKRWQELEAQQAPAPAIPQTWAQALRLAAEQAEQLEQQQAALALAAPKVEFVNRYVEADTGAMGFRQVCKLLGANEARFRDFLTSAKVMYLLGGVWTPHAQHMNTGRFVVKTGHAKQNDHVFTQAKFTSKGVEWVSGLWRLECERVEKMGVK